MLQHSGVSRAGLVLHVSEDEVRVRLSNPAGPARPAPGASSGTGHGLVGIRERVHLLGGRTDAGPTPEGGYGLQVAIPLPADRPVTHPVVVADDQHLVRAGLCGILESADDLTVVGEAANGAEAVSAVRELRPDVVLMDVRMPGMDGLEATRIIVRDTDARVVVLTTFDLDEYVFTALEAGASGFLLKDTPAARLQEAVRVVASGDALLSPVGHPHRHRSARPPTAGPPRRADARLAGLTPRERETLDLVARGLSNAEIAGRLNITAGTVKTHVGHLLTKLDARDRIQLVILAHTAPDGPARPS